ncbi:NAF1-domain-containing protein [Stipitochalara longipes BDJ]|nr:NAF1-domain-containing protein [Stipitochalara longipes BDJ]
MDHETSEAPDSARTTIPTENIPHVENEEQAPTAETNTDEALTTDTNTRDTDMQNSTMDIPPSPPLTHALEALLGGLDPPADVHSISIIQPVVEEKPHPAAPIAFGQQEVEKPADQLGIPGLFSLSREPEHTEPNPVASEEPVPGVDAELILAREELQSGEAPPTSNDAVMEDVQNLNTVAADKPISAEIASTSEAVPAIAVENSNAPTDAQDADGGEHPEWEIDSSPIESSSDDDSSDDSSSDESEEGDNAYKLLSPEEQARILMAGDGGSDDEGDKPKGSGGQLRTKNEVPEEVIPKPDVTVTPDMKITELGSVETIVDNILLIKAKTSGEYKVLETGSVLCLEDRSVIGVVAETLGRVQQPLYSVLFTNAGELTGAGLALATKVFYSEQHSTYVFTQNLKAYKGSDASNLHDEEVGDEEMEFSDDEAEAEHKRRVKQKKLEKRGGKMQQNGGSGRGGHPLQQQHTPYDASNGISYDDAEDEGPYKPLARPAGYADSVGRSEAPQEGGYSGERPNFNQNKDQFRGRGRADRGRGRGDRGRGRGGYQNQRGGSNGYSLPPQSQQYQPPSPGPGAFSSPFQPQGTGLSSVSPPGTSPPNFFNTPSAQQYSPHQPQLPAWPQFPPMPPFQHQPYSQPFQGGQGWPSMPGAAPLNGAFINPAFFNNNQTPSPGQWNNQGQGQGRGRGRGNGGS